MATSLKATSTLGLSGSYTSTGTKVTGTTPIAETAKQDYTNGTGDNTADVPIIERRAATETIDLTSDLTDIYGNTANLAKIREITIVNLSTTSGETLTISGNFMTAVLGNASYTVVIPPGGRWHQTAPVDGFTVTNTTQDQMTVTKAAGTGSYDLVILGEQT